MSSTEETGRMIMVLEPTWQSFSSMYREAVSASSAATGMEISHHRTAALYFGIAALECILNREMTRHQSRLGRGHDEINNLLRRPKFKIKLEKWPEEITGRPLQLRPETI